ncbi:MAG: zinc ribbon domain-containing protein [Magnetococcales bacterium]|nr:zinc ribbon domain-containing protein [Magnetococcales bacterium]
MPLYEYACDGCKIRFEKNHPMSDPPPKNCPECGAEKVRKIFATGGIVGSVKSGGDAPGPACGIPNMGGGSCGGGMCGF